MDLLVQAPVGLDVDASLETESDHGRLALGVDADGAPDVAGAGLLRTARWLFDGEVCIPNRAWPQGGKP